MRRRTPRPATVTTAVAVAAGTLALAAAATLAGCGGGRHATAAGHPVSGRLLVGAVFTGPAVSGAVNLGRQLDLAVASGVESVRVVFDWSRAQPYASETDVPAAQRGQFQNLGGVPTRFADLDRIVAAAAARGISLLPVVEYAPNWDALHPGRAGSPPRSTAPYGAFLTALERRYGPRGTFWAAHPRSPRVPIRMWQIWNEPHFVSYWSERPFAPSYVKLLAAAHAAVHAADPGGKVVLAGLADFSWRYLAQIYRVPGARQAFDIAALHPYTAQPGGVIVIMRRARSVMDRFGDRAKPMLATEITWPSSQGKARPQFGVSTTERQQAARLLRLMPLLVANRTRLGLMGFYWFSWMGDETLRPNPDAFDYAGLLKYVRGTVTAKPALAVFRRLALSIEGCRRKLTPARCAA